MSLTLRACALLLLSMPALVGCTTVTRRYSYVVPLQAQRDPALVAAAQSCYLACGREDPAGGRRFFSCIASCPGARVEKGDVCDEMSQPDYGCHLWRVRRVEADDRAIADAVGQIIVGTVRVAATVAVNGATSSGGSRKSSPSRRSSGRASAPSSGSKSKGHTLASPSRGGSKRHSPAAPSRGGSKKRSTATPSKK